MPLCLCCLMYLCTHVMYIWLYSTLELDVLKYVIHLLCTQVLKRWPDDRQKIQQDFSQNLKLYKGILYIYEGWSCKNFIKITGLYEAQPAFGSGVAWRDTLASRRHVTVDASRVFIVRLLQRLLREIFSAETIAPWHNLSNLNLAQLTLTCCTPTCSLHQLN